MKKAYFTSFAVALLFLSPAVSNATLEWQEREEYCAKLANLKKEDKLGVFIQCIQIPIRFEDAKKLEDQ